MKILTKIKEKFGTVPCPGWLFLMFVVLYCEALVHLWTMDAFNASRFWAVMAFALGFGGVLAVVMSFIRWPKLQRWLTVTVAMVLIVFYMAEYFISDAYQNFMPLVSVFTGAKGVATDFGDIVVDMLLQNLWRIALVVLPVVLYALFAKPVDITWKLRWFVTVGTLAAYLLGYYMVMHVGTDAARMGTAYNFDGAVRAFGLSMGLTLDTVKGGEQEAEGQFVVQTPPPVVVTPSPAVQENPDDETVPEETEVVYGYNVLDLDFTALAEQMANTNGRVARIHSYVASVEPTQQNEYTGLFAGKNLILITAEAFAAEVIDPELTPTLYRLANEGIKFEDYYQPMWGGSTSTGEYSVLTGLVAASGTYSVHEARQQDLFLTMGNQLQRQGYYSVAYHNHLYSFYDRDKTHTHFGYDTYIGMGTGMEEGVKERWPESDLEMMDFTVPQYIDQQPFSVYYMTVSGHCRYNQLGNKMSGKNYELVKDLPYSETVKCYIAANLELEFALESLVRQLEEAGIADDTVIVLSTDHYPYGLEQSDAWNNKESYISELYGYRYSSIVERDHNALIIWSGCIEDMDIVVEDPVYSLDILPTLSNLFGVPYDSRLLVGRDVFSDAEPIVLWYDHTWRTDMGTYTISNGQFVPNEGVVVDDGYVERIAAIVANKITYSREVASTDYFNYVSEALFGEPEEE